MAVSQILPNDRNPAQAALQASLQAKADEDPVESSDAADNTIAVTDNNNNAGQLNLESSHETPVVNAAQPATEESKTNPLSAQGPLAPESGAAAPSGTVSRYPKRTNTTAGAVAA